MELIQFLVQLLLLHQLVVEAVMVMAQLQQVILVVQEAGLMAILLLAERETHPQLVRLKEIMVEILLVQVEAVAVELVL
tara:strand:+ start:80 stop:316 length:237 start_codon:yes stop_codon:yes gene_type:complete